MPTDRRISAVYVTGGNVVRHDSHVDDAASVQGKASQALQHHSSPDSGVLVTLCRETSDVGEQTPFPSGATKPNSALNTGIIVVGNHELERTTAVALVID